jgi:hypothetical protein
VQPDEIRVDRRQPRVLPEGCAKLLLGSIQLAHLGEKSGEVVSCLDRLREAMGDP